MKGWRSPAIAGIQPDANPGILATIMRSDGETDARVSILKEIPLQPGGRAAFNPPQSDNLGRAGKNVEVKCR
jgi:hypothetical protein